MLLLRLFVALSQGAHGQVFHVVHNITKKEYAMKQVSLLR